MIVYAETVFHELKKVLSSDLATMVVSLHALTNQHLHLLAIVDVEHPLKLLLAQAVAKAKSSTVTLSHTIADAQHAKVQPKATSSTVTPVHLLLL